MRRLRRFLLWFVAVTVGILLFVVVGILLFFPVEKVKALAVQRGSQALGRSIKVGDLEVSFWGGLGVRLLDIIIENPESMSDMEPLLVAEGIDLKLRLWPLLSSEIRVDRLIIEQPRISLLTDEQGNNNYTFTLDDSSDSKLAESRKPQEVSAAAAGVSFDQFDIVDGTVSFIDLSRGTSAQVSGLAFESQLETARDDLYVTRGGLSVDSVLHSAVGSDPLVNISLSYTAEYDMTSGMATINRAELTVGEILLTAYGEGSITKVGPEFRMNVTGEGIDIADVISGAPEKWTAPISDISLSGGVSLHAELFSDYANEEFSLRYSGTAMLENIAARREGLTAELNIRRGLVSFKPDNIRISVENGEFDGKPLLGHAVISEFDEPKIAGELGAKVDLSFLKEFVSVLRTGELAGLADVNLKFSGLVSKMERADFSGEVRVRDGRYTSDGVLEPLDSLYCDIYFDRSTVNIHSLSARSGSGYLNVSGRCDGLTGWLLADSASALHMRPAVDIHLSGEVDLAFAGRFLPDRGKPEVAGNLEFDMKVIGQINRLSTIRPSGRISISQGRYNDSLLPEPVEQLSANMTLTPDSIVVSSFDMRFSSSDLGFKGILSNPFPYLLPFESEHDTMTTRPYFRFILSAHRFDTDRLFPEAVPVTEADQVSTPPANVSVLFLPDIDGNGSLRADTLIYGDVLFTSLTGLMTFKDGRLTFTGMNAKVFSGSVSGETTIDLSDLKTPSYSGTFLASSIDADGFMDRFTSYGGYLSGKVDVSGSYDAQGWEPESFLRSLDMTGNGSLSEGVVTTSGAMYNVISELAKRTGQSFAKVQPVRNLSTEFVVSDGRVRADELKTSLGSIGDIRIGGFYGFDSTLSYQGEILLSEELSGKLLNDKGVRRLLGGLLSSGRQKRATIPFVIDGTIKHPNVRLSWETLGEKAAENLKDKAGSALRDLFKKDN